MLKRAELEPAPDRLVRRRPHLVRTPRPEELVLPEREPEMRPVELVRRADEDVHVPRRDVDRAVLRVVHGVGPGERAGLVREVDDPADVRRRADRVRGDRERDDARPLRELRGEIVVVELELVGKPGVTDDDAEVVRELEPGRDVGVVVELRHDDLVARAQRPRERAREQEVERRHARAERDLIGRAAEERRRALREVATSAFVRCDVSYGASRFAFDSRR